jgi:hypothetical protein
MTYHDVELLFGLRLRDCTTGAYFDCACGDGENPPPWEEWRDQGVRPGQPNSFIRVELRGPCEHGELIHQGDPPLRIARVLVNGVRMRLIGTLVVDPLCVAEGRGVGGIDD